MRKPWLSYHLPIDLNGKWLECLAWSIYHNFKVLGGGTELNVSGQSMTQRFHAVRNTRLRHRLSLPSSMLWSSKRSLLHLIVVSSFKIYQSIYRKKGIWVDQMTKEVFIRRYFQCVFNPTTKIRLVLVSPIKMRQLFQLTVLCRQKRRITIPSLLSVALTALITLPPLASSEKRGLWDILFSDVKHFKVFFYFRIPLTW